MSIHVKLENNVPTVHSPEEKHRSLVQERRIQRNSLCLLNLMFMMKGLGTSSIEHLPGVCAVLHRIPSTERKSLPVGGGGACL